MHHFGKRYYNTKNGLEVIKIHRFSLYLLVVSAVVCCLEEEEEEEDDEEDEEEKERRPKTKPRTKTSELILELKLIQGPHQRSYAEGLLRRREGHYDL